MKFSLLLLLANVLGLFPLVFASEFVTLGEIQVFLRSSVDSDPNTFPVQVSSQTAQFLGEVFSNEYGEHFERVDVSVHSRGIEADGNSAEYVATLDLSGTVFFKDGMRESMVNNIAEEVLIVLQNAFLDYKQVFVAILGESSDPFLSQVSYALVRVNGDDIVAGGSASDDIGSESLETWLVAFISAASAFAGVLCLCLICICCVGEANDDQGDAQPTPEIAKSGSGGSDPTNATNAVSSADEHDLEHPVSNIITTNDIDDTGNTFLDLNLASITSQNSSQFTYNPASLRSVPTFGSFAADNTVMDYEAEEWKKASVLNQGFVVPPPFGQDISAIEHKRDLSLVQEGDREVSTTRDDPNSSSVTYYTNRRARSNERGQQSSLDLTRSAQDVIDDLNDLSDQVAAYRTNSRQSSD